MKLDTPEDRLDLQIALADAAVEEHRLFQEARERNYRFRAHTTLKNFLYATLQTAMAGGTAMIKRQDLRTQLRTGMFVRAEIEGLRGPGERRRRPGVTTMYGTVTALKLDDGPQIRNVGFRLNLYDVSEDNAMVRYLGAGFSVAFGIDEVAEDGLVTTDTKIKLRLFW